MIRIAVCDSDKSWRDLIAKMITKSSEPSDVNIDVYETGTELLLSYKEKKNYDLLFLETAFDDIDVVELLNQIKEIGRLPVLFFVTNSFEHLQFAFKIRAFQSFLKDSDEEKIQDEIKRVLMILKREDRKITVKSNQNEYELKIDKIIYVETEAHHICVHVNNVILPCSGSLSSMYEKLKNYGFIKCSQSYIVNYKHIKKIKKDEILLANGEVIYVSRGNKKEFVMRYKDCISGLIS